MVYSRPVIAGDVLYFGSGDYYLYALDVKTGKELWKFKAGNMACYPTVWQGMVFFGDATGNTLYALH
jgi:outer membrane protein assembly factor BamB